MDSYKVALFLKKLSALEFKPMSVFDFRTFGGVQNDDALIAYTNNDYAVIIDGSLIVLVNQDGSEHQITLSNGVIVNDDVLNAFLED